MTAPTARSVCLTALRQWEQRKGFADDILHQQIEENRLAPVDRAFLTEVFYGILRNLAAVDFLILRLGRDDLDTATRQVLRLGLYQIFHMRIPDHAAVNETVDLAGRGRKLVNALLRRSLREQEDLRQAILNASMAVRYSHPEFLVERWTRQFGPDNTRLLCEWNNTPAPVYVTANTLKVTAGELLRASPDAAPSGLHPLALKVRQIPFLWIANGLCYVQDPSTLVAPDLLAPEPGETVLDACAAPGGKASYMAGLMHNEGTLVACDGSTPRLRRMKENFERLGLDLASIVQESWQKPSRTLKPESFDRILVDVPCTNSGVIRRRVDVRWRLTPEDFIRMPQRQFDIVRSVSRFLKPGGRLVYSTCSLEPEENEELAERITRNIEGMRLIETSQSLPFRDGMDGAYAALFQKG